jgi:hypothetical protein
MLQLRSLGEQPQLFDFGLGAGAGVLSPPPAGGDAVPPEGFLVPPPLLRR